jgi:hypothetical protein
LSTTTHPVADKPAGQPPCPLTNQRGGACTREAQCHDACRPASKAEARQLRQGKQGRSGAHKGAGHPWMGGQARAPCFMQVGWHRAQRGPTHAPRRTIHKAIHKTSRGGECTHRRQPLSATSSCFLSSFLTKCSAGVVGGQHTAATTRITAHRSAYCPQVIKSDMEAQGTLWSAPQP